MFGSVILDSLSNWWGIVIRSAFFFFFSCFLSICCFFLWLFFAVIIFPKSARGRASLLAYQLPSISGRSLPLWPVLVYSSFFSPAFSQLSCVRVDTWILGDKERVTSAIFPARYRSSNPLDNFPIPKSPPLKPVPAWTFPRRWLSVEGSRGISIIPLINLFAPGTRKV